MDRHLPDRWRRTADGGETLISAPDRALRTLIVLVVCAIAFVYHTCRSLPQMVASHFDGAGVATGFVQRAVYERVAIGMLLLPPILLGIVPRLSLRNPTARINVPHARYWLAPERRADTIALIEQECAKFAGMLLFFLCYAHWLVVHANQSVPPSLQSGWLVAGLAVSLGVTVRWVIFLLGRFRLDEE